MDNFYFFIPEQFIRHGTPSFTEYFNAYSSTISLTFAIWNRWIWSGLHWSEQKDYLLLWQEMHSLWIQKWTEKKFIRSLPRKNDFTCVTVQCMIIRMLHTICSCDRRRRQFVCGDFWHHLFRARAPAKLFLLGAQ